MKFTLLSVVAIAAAASDSYAAPAASSLAGPVTTGIFSAVSAIPSFATNLSGQVASATSSVLSGNTASGSSATAAPAPSASGASSMQSMASSLSGSAFSPSSMMPIASGNMTMPNMTSSASASSAASTATGVAGGAGSNSSSSCAPTSLPASATELPTTVPTGTVITGDYTGSYRPQVHYSPPKGFMNDPNGCFRDTNGTYHLYYQYNPLEYVAGNQHWGHATSDDLYHWTNQPIAIFPPNSTSQVFSGSAVLDPNNTSGFFPNTTDGVVAVYTLNTPTLQVQEVAYSTDGGYNFTPYENNPVLSVGSNQFRDPKVFWYEDHFVMAVAAANDFTIEIYTSPNLTSWTFASNFTHHGLLGLAYECPNLVQVPFQDDPSQSAWLMYISINPGAPLGGSVGQYFPGDFNGTHFVAYDSAARIADFAKDNYASQWFADTENGESISIAWASNWQYTQQVPTGPDQGFRSAMSLPRRNYLTNITRLGWDLVSLPYDLSPVVGPSLLSSTEANSTADVDFTNVTSNAVWFSLNVTLPDAAIQNASLIAADASINITFLPSTKCSSSSGSGSDSPAATLTYFYAGLTNGALALTRPAASSSWGAENPFFTDKFSYTLVDPLTSLVGVFDRSMLEVFVNEGAHSATMLVFPDSPVGSMKVATGGLPEGTQVNLQVNGLESTWQSS